MDKLTARKFVRQMYRSILKREPDKSGENYYTDLMIQDGYDAIFNIMNSFISSEEFESRIASRWSYEKVLFHETPIDLCISLGVDCLSASKIMQIGKRVGSFPFDWCFSSPEMLNHILEDDFRVFLDRSYFRPNPDINRENPHINLCDHEYYEKKYDVKNVFNHKNPANDVDFDYYKRCVDRFRAAIHSADRKLFVIASWRSDYSLSSFLKMIDILNDISKNHAVILINIRNKSGQKSGAYIRYRAGNDCLIDLYCNSSSSNGLNLEDKNADNEFNKLLISRLNGSMELYTPQA